MLNKVNIIIVNKINCHFFGIFFGDEKHMGECMNKKHFYFYIFNIRNFDRDFGVTLIALTG